MIVALILFPLIIGFSWIARRRLSKRFGFRSRRYIFASLVLSLAIPFLQLGLPLLWSLRPGDSLFRCPGWGDGGACECTREEFVRTVLLFGILSAPLLFCATTGSLVVLLTGRSSKNGSQ